MKRTKCGVSLAVKQSDKKEKSCVQITNSAPLLLTGEPTLTRRWSVIIHRPHMRIACRCKLNGVAIDNALSKWSEVIPRSPPQYKRIALTFFVSSMLALRLVSWYLPLKYTADSNLVLSHMSKLCGTTELLTGTI